MVAGGGQGLGLNDSAKGVGFTWNLKSVQFSSVIAAAASVFGFLG